MTHTYTTTHTDLCRRCEHPADWHRHDDTAPPLTDGHNSHGINDHDERLCPCRCVGYDPTIDGPVGEPCGCPDFASPEEGTP